MMDRLVAMAGGLGVLLKAQGGTLAVAESSAGGLVSAALLSVPGASAYYRGGGVIYTREARRALLGLPEDGVTMRGASEDYALIVARAVGGAGTATEEAAKGAMEGAIEGDEASRPWLEAGKAEPSALEPALEKAKASAPEKGGAND